MIEEKVGHGAKDTKEAKMSMKANDPLQQAGNR